jgi:cyclase
MSFPRLIPVISILGEGAVKTKSFGSPKYVGDPVNTAALFSSFEVEELLVIDISRSYSTTPVSNSTLSRIIENAYMPIGYGGGVSDIHRARELFKMGFDKLVVRDNLLNINLVKAISEEFGNQALSGCADFQISSQKLDTWLVNGIEYKHEQLQELMLNLDQIGIGELIMQDVEQDGLRSGLRLTPPLSIALSTLSIPVVAMGGCKDPDDAATFITLSGCHSVAASTTFLFRSTRDAVLVNYPKIESWHQRLGMKE